MQYLTSSPQQAPIRRPCHIQPRARARACVRACVLRLRARHAVLGDTAVCVCVCVCVYSRLLARHAVLGGADELGEAAGADIELLQVPEAEQPLRRNESKTKYIYIIKYY